jgi:hypothetical protein
MLTLRIESASRWDALALTRKLAHYHWFMVEPDLEHWDVYVSLEDDDRGDGLPLGELRESLLDWLDERRLDAARIHAPEADIVLTRG